MFRSNAYRRPKLIPDCLFTKRSIPKATKKVPTEADPIACNQPFRHNHILHTSRVTHHCNPLPVGDETDVDEREGGANQPAAPKLLHC